MKKHELIKFAYDNYPKGTIFYQLASGKEIKSSGVFKIIEGGGGFGICDDENGNGVYAQHSNRWAGIKPEAISLSGGASAVVNGEDILIEFPSGDKYACTFADLDAINEQRPF